MADVRLTATNPEDSSVVPVACDAAGRLLLEEPVQGPPGQQGPPGEQGPPGQDGQDGDPFSGNFAGDVTFGGSAEFDGNVQVGGNAVNGAEQGTVLGAGGALHITRTSGANNYVFRGYALGNYDATIKFASNGTAEFAGNVSVGDVGNNSTAGTVIGLSNRTAYINIKGDGTSTGAVVGVLGGGNQSINYIAQINGDGSCSFAGSKAGFTKEGYLWCTTRRGDTVILDATSNGLASWVEYTPTTRLDEIRDKLDANRGS